MSRYSALYKVVWFWKEDILECYDARDRKPSIKIQTTTTTTTSTDKSPGPDIRFSENIDQTKQSLFKQKYQRFVSKNRPCVVTVQDIKDVVTFLAVGTIPKDFLVLFHSCEISSFLRALIVYFQLYLQVLEDLDYRRKYYATHLKHPESIVRETICKNQLGNLRSRVGQIYAGLIIGSGMFGQFHHMKNSNNNSSSVKDIKMYKHLLSFSIRVVWIALGRTCFSEIENEMLRMFGSRNIDNDYLSSLKTYSDQNILYGGAIDGVNRWNVCSAVIQDIYLNQDKYELSPCDFLTTVLEDSIVSGTDALLNLPEELFGTFGLVLGILGQPRTNFEPLLNVNQEQLKIMNEGNLDTNNIAILEPFEKPIVKLYQYLGQLVTNVNISLGHTNEDHIVGSIKEQINLFVAYQKRDSENAIVLWCDRR